MKLAKKLQEYIDQHRVVEFCLVMILFTALVLGVTIGLGTMFSGWHFVDDHEILEWTNPLRSGKRTLLEEAAILFPSDYAARFRPLYYPVRLLTFLVVGDNLVVYEALKAFEAILGMVLLYYVGKTCGGSVGASLLFSLLSMTGYQSAIWWKLGPQEPQGVIYFAAGMLLLNLYLKTGKRFLSVLSWISLLIMCNWKESFIVLMPFVILYVVYRSMPEKGMLLARVLSGVRAHIVYLAASAVMLVVIIGIIVFVVGTNNSSGAGIGVSPRTILSSYQWAFTHDLKYYYAVTLVVTAILLTYWTELKSMWMEIVLFAVFLLPNLLIYGKEAMAERYIIPSAIGYALFYVVAVYRKGFLSGKRKWVYEAALLVLFALGLRSTIIEADYYRYRGESVTASLEYASYAAENGSNVLSCLSYSNPEAQWTIDAWMEYKGHLESLYYWEEGDLAIYDAASYAGPEDVDSLETHTQVDLENVDVVIAYNTDDRHYTGMCELVIDGLLEEDFTKVTVGTIDVYVRNGVSLELPDGNIKTSIYS